MNDQHPPRLAPALPFLLGPESPDWRACQTDPLPPWGSGNFTLFNCEKGHLDGDARCHTGIYSVPFDTTSSTRAGSRKGPMAIRRASLQYSAQQKSRSIAALHNLRTGQSQAVNPPGMVDFGDLHCYPADPKKQTATLYAEASRAMALCDRAVMLGGEHTVSIGNFYAAALRAKRAGKRLGYVQIDHHFDFGDHSVLHGNLYHGCNGRRVAEHPDVRPEAFGFVGQGDLTGAGQLRYLQEAGFRLGTMALVRRQGFGPTLSQVLGQVMEACDQLYVSIDIDVCENATAPGTGHATFGGINATDFLAMAEILQGYPVVAIDLVEVSPEYDPSGATASLAARLLFEYLFLQQAT